MNADAILSAFICVHLRLKKILLISIANVINF
jgi:hypothetical protein